MVISVRKMRQLLKGKHAQTFIVVDPKEVGPEFTLMETKIINYILGGKTYSQAQRYLGFSKNVVSYAMAKHNRLSGKVTFIDTLNKKRKREKICRQNQDSVTPS